MELQNMNHDGSSEGSTGQCTFKQWKCLKPSPFKGSTDLMEAETWVKQIQKIFGVINHSEAQKVPFATFMLEGEVDHQWDMTKRILKNDDGDGDGEFITWEMFLATFYEKYFPVSVRFRKEAEFHRLIQGNKRVANYEAKFIELSRFAPHAVVDEPTRTRKFLDDLRPNIKSKLALFMLTQYAAMVNRALIIEQSYEDFSKTT